jgi:hypothetical protein
MTTPPPAPSLSAETLRGYENVAATLRHYATVLDRVDWEGGSVGASIIDDAADALDVLVRAARQGGEDRTDAERYRFLRDNPIQLRAIDGNASFCGQWSAEHFDDFTDAGMAEAARARATGGEP